MTSLVIIWQRFGPYHLARLKGAQRVLQSVDWNVTGLEIARTDQYAWRYAACNEVDRVTTFANASYESIPHWQLRAHVTKTLDELGPSAVAINGWSVPEAIAALRWCRAHRRPAILMSETHQPSGIWWKEMIKRWRVRRFDSALVGGGWHADYLVSLGFSRKRILLGYDAVDNDHFAQHQNSTVDQRRVLRKQQRLPETYFFANIRFLARKNIDGLLRAYSAYRSQCKSSEPWDLVISGNGEMEVEWKALARRLDIAQNVHWPGFLQYESLPIYYALASAFVHPAHQEAWGLVVNEAAAASLPLIVGNRVGASCELVREAENGFLVDSTNDHSIARALFRMTQLPHDERKQFGEASRRMVSDFGPERFGKGLQGCLSSAFGASVGKGRVTN